jgi:tetratricopeptide (TPR) repeat protein
VSVDPESRQPAPEDPPADSEQHSEHPSPDPSQPEPPQPEPSQPETAPVEPAGQDAAGDELPDWEELTPELMEDECLRGDAMLRGAVVLLALLLGWTYVTETPLLVSIRTGEQVSGNGWLPLRTDSFSATAEGRSWVNLGWLSDLLLSLVHQAAGMNGLTVFSAVTALAVFWLLRRIHLPDVSTWWASVCLGVGLVAVFPVLQAGTSSITLLGLTLLLAVLFRSDRLVWRDSSRDEAAGQGGRGAEGKRGRGDDAELSPSPLSPHRPVASVPPSPSSPPPPVADAYASGLPWSLPVLFLFWTNLDPRAWIGLLLLILFVVVRQFTTQAASAETAQRNWLVTAVTMAVGVLAHPWPGSPALSFLTQLQVNREARAYGGLSEFFPSLSFSLLDLPLWERLDLFLVAALVLLAVSLITIVLNFKRLHWGWLAVWLGINLLSLIYGGVWAYAAMVNAVVAILNGQDWYRHNFSMEFTIDTWSVLYTRVGRAVTVLSFFVLAYTAVNGALMGAGGRRVGMGLDPRWENRIESTGKILAGTYTERVFPMLPSQGDVVLWLGKKPFVDSRLALYAGGEVNLAERHRSARTSLFAPPSPDGLDDGPDPELWKEIFLEHETYDVLMRLWGAEPAYEPFFQMMLKQGWILTGFGAAGANFTRSDLPEESLRNHVTEHRQTRFVQQAFVDWTDTRSTILPPTWPRAASAYDRWLIQKVPVHPNTAQLARHYHEIRIRLGQFLTPQQGAALASLAIRHARQALFEDPNNPSPYRVLSDAYLQLQALEQHVTLLGGGASALPLRGNQALATAYHAARASGEEPQDLFHLFQVLTSQEKFDVALEVMNRLERKLDRDEFEETLVESELGMRLIEHVETVETEIASARTEEELSRSQLVMMAINGRCPALALSIIEEDLTEFVGDPSLQMLYATLLLDNGRTDEAWEQFELMEQMIPRDGVPPQMIGFVSQWRNMTALANLAVGEVDRAIQLWTDEARTQSRTTLNSLLSQPFGSGLISIQHDLWPATMARAVVGALIQFPERWAQLHVEQALVQLEVGRLERATELLQGVLEGHPEYSQRGLVVFYLTMLTGEEYDITRPSDRIPVWPGMFAPDEEDVGEPQE